LSGLVVTVGWQRERLVAFATIPDSGPSRTWAWGVWPRIGGRVTPDLAFGAQSLFVSWPGGGSLAPRAFSLPLGELEPPDPVVLPTAAELIDAKPCGNTQAPRIELGWVEGARTPIVVKYEKSTLYHATVATFGHGKTKDDVCSSALLAGSGYGDSAWTLLLSGSTEPARGFAYVRAKPNKLISLKCTKSTAPLPTRFASMPGFRQ
jgi:hypothetical protein